MAPAKVARIKRRLARGERKVTICREEGVGENVVRRIELGAHFRDLDAEAPGETVRCGGCGGLILVSAGFCRACYLRATDPRQRSAGCGQKTGIRVSNRAA